MLTFIESFVIVRGMSISKKEVQYVAGLCRIHLDEKELNRLSSQLEDILKFVDQLKKLDVKDIIPTSHILAVENVFRKDKVRPSIPCPDVLKNAPQAQEGFFRVPPVIE